MPLTYRFNVSGQMEIQALNEADARDKLSKHTFTHFDKATGVFVLVVPTTLMMILDTDYKEIDPSDL